MSMRRIILTLTVAALLAVMMVATVGPAFAGSQVGSAGGGDCGWDCGWAK
jgi:hypothetical protein